MLLFFLLKDYKLGAIWSKDIFFVYNTVIKIVPHMIARCLPHSIEKLVQGVDKKNNLHTMDTSTKSLKSLYDLSNLIF